VRVVLAAKGIYALDMRDIASMGVPDPGGDKYHQDDWTSNDGVTKREAGHWLGIWVHIARALLRNIIIAMDPLVSGMESDQTLRTYGSIPGRGTEQAKRRPWCHIICNG
jgi:hypothetical protein